MTISSTSNKAQFNGSGTTGPFAFTFKVFDQGDLTVVKTNTTTLVETTLAITTDYTVSLNADQNNNPGGTVTTVATVDSGYKLTILRVVDATQETDITNGGGFYPEVIENALDRVTMLCQQNAEELDRALLIGVGSIESTEDLVDRVIAIDTAVVDAQTAQAAAEAAQAAAEVAQVAAELAETNAETAETNAETAETNAEAAQAAAEAALASIETTITAITPTFAQFSGDGAEVNFTLPTFPSSEDMIDVYISGVYQQKSQYSVTGQTLTFTAAPPLGTNNIEVKIAPSVAFVAPGSEDWGLITAAPTATEDYGALV